MWNWKLNFGIRQLGAEDFENLIWQMHYSQILPTEKQME